MMTKKMIIEELTNRGYLVSEPTCIKNGIEVIGLAVKKDKEDKVVPTIYIEDIIKGAYERNLSVAEVVDYIIPMMESRPSFDVERFTDRGYITSHVHIGVQKEGAEELVKRKSSFEGIEEYLYISDESQGQGFSVKLKAQMLEKAGLNEKGLFAIAQANNHEEFTAEPLMGIVAQLMGKSPIEDDDIVPMYVISNKSKLRGASAMLDGEGIGELANRIGIHEFVLLPSSIHECILVPKTGDVNMEMFENMVKEINATTVDPLDRLVDRAYLLTA